MTDASTLEVGRTALELADEAIDFAAELDVASRRLDGGTTVVDLGIEAPGSRDAGLLLAAARRGGAIAAELGVRDLDTLAWPFVEMSCDHPLVAQHLATTERIGPLHVSGPGADGQHDPFAVVVAYGTEPIDESAASSIAEAIGTDTGELYVLTAAPGSIAWGVDAAVETLSVSTRAVEEAIDDGSVTDAVVEAPAVPAMDDPDDASDLGVQCRRLAGRAHLGVSGDVVPQEVAEEAISPRNEDGPAVVTVVDRHGRAASAGAPDHGRLADELRA